MYDWNMRFNPKQEIKGDYMVKARGASALVAKELRQHAIQGFLAATSNPLDAPYTKRGYLLREGAKALDLEVDRAVLTEQEEQELIKSGLLPGLPSGGAGGTGAPGANPAEAGLPPGGAAQVLSQ
jgi:hypothetical protein